MDEEEFGMDEPEIATPAPTNASAVATKAVSPSKETPATSPLVKTVQASSSGKGEDAIKTTEAPITEEKKTEVEQKKEEKKTVTPGTKKEIPKKKLSFEESKAARAKRFGIPIHAGKRQQGHTDKNTKKQKTEKPPQAKDENTKEEIKTKSTKSTKTDLSKKEMHSLSKEEVEQRIKRIGRFGESTTSENLKKIDELKSILRLHRFTKETEG